MYNNSDQYFKDCDPMWNEEQTCLVEEFFRKEAEKPHSQRSNSCMISCSCPKCNPTTL